jgi:SAM-dependent methyltransferase
VSAGNPEALVLEMFEEEYFQTIYGAAYDQRNPRYKHRSYLREVKRVARTGGALLDVGCAYGAFLREAAGDFVCSGCDISAHAVRVAAARVPTARIFHAAIHEIEPSAAYDVITCFDVLEHVPDIDRALLHLRTLLKPGAALVATMPVYDTLVGRLVERLDRDPTHVHKLSRYEWLDRITAAGFRLVSWKGILRYYGGGPCYLHWCGNIVRRFSPAILVTAGADFPASLR